MSRPGKRPAVALIAAGMLLMNAAALAAPQELTLQGSIAAAVANNPALKMAQADRDKAAWGIDEAEAGRLPTLSLGSTYSRQPAAGLSPASDGVNTSLRMNWQVYNGGRTEGLIDQAEQGLSSAGAGVSKAEQQVRLDAASGYFAVLLNSNLVAVNEQTVKNLREHLTTAQAKYNAGLVAKGDVLRSEVELANAEQNFIKSQNAYDLALASLKNVMGFEQTGELTLTDQLKFEEYAKTLDESIALARAARPEIIQAEAGVGMAESGLRVAESGRLPTITVGASKGWADSWLPESGGDWSMNVTASWNIFDAGVTNAKVRQADAGLDKALQQAEQTLDAIELEVRQVYLSMKEAEKRLATTEVAVAKAEEDLTIARTKYDAGVGTNLDVIDAQLSLAQARTNHYQALYDYNVNKAKLAKATGQAVQ